MADSRRPGAGLQIRADFLGGDGAADRAPGFPEADNATPDSRVAETDTRGSPWRSRDLRRALAAAQKAGIERYRVEIAPDGTISIVVGFGETGPV